MQPKRKCLNLIGCLGRLSVIRNLNLQDVLRRNLAGLKWLDEGGRRAGHNHTSVITNSKYYCTVHSVDLKANPFQPLVLSLSPLFQCADLLLESSWLLL